MKISDRVRQLNSAPFRGGSRYVLYWAQMNRRVESNHALAFAAQTANEQGLPLLFYEGVTCSYPHANDRLHTFLLEGVPETARRLKKKGIGYAFHARKRQADPNDTLYRLAAGAAALVTDDYPTFVARRHNASVPAKLDIPYFAVDSSCGVPMCQMDKREYAAYTIRPKIQRLLPKYLVPAPEVSVQRKFAEAAPELPAPPTEGEIPALVASCEIDHSIAPSAAYRGGRAEAERLLRLFLTENLRRYAKDRNEPSAHATSDMSPYLHFGHISSLEIALAARQYAEEHKLIASEFLEELIVRRELAFNFARFSDDPESMDNLPAWALATLRKHDGDERPVVYTRRQLERAATHDALWNATQKEMLIRGKIHGYYRMYWGKKIIEWSRTHQEALRTMIEIHDRHALDGRDPNTYTNILWCFGLHDRPWFERPIFGQIRYMSYEGMKRKTNVDAYIREIEDLEKPTQGRLPL
ncbi:MAG TPA: deoxyribodipyrimidine photo-lyase [Bryobacteraceae bacterium]|nr:deoxyribodipyrimidine photo-lyase [Bryobacteraceae bacterium]